MEKRSRSHTRRVEYAAESATFSPADPNASTNDDIATNITHGPSDANVSTPQHPSRVPDAATEAPVTSTPREMTFSQGNVEAIIAAMQKSQNETIQSIIQTLSQTAPAPETATMARCKATFGGSRSESVQTFIESVESYIDCCKCARNTNAARIAAPPAQASRVPARAPSAPLQAVARSPALPRAAPELRRAVPPPELRCAAAPGPEPRRPFAAPAQPTMMPAADSTGGTNTKKYRSQCSYCHRYNHTKENCRKLENRVQKPVVLKIHDYRIIVREPVVLKIHDYRIIVRKPVVLKIHDYQIIVRKPVVLKIHD
ncbi:hypothetical protein ACJJTC_002971 [Scirpophaga incertulas]